MAHLLKLILVWWERRMVLEDIRCPFDLKNLSLINSFKQNGIKVSAGTKYMFCATHFVNYVNIACLTSQNVVWAKSSLTNERISF